MKRKLTPKQKRFANKYIESGNATQAAVEAGFNANGDNLEDCLKKYGIVK